MKTAETWHQELYSSRHGQCEIITQAEIKQIQADAYAQGSRDVMSSFHQHFDCYIKREIHPIQSLYQRTIDEIKAKV